MTRTDSTEPRPVADDPTLCRNCQAPAEMSGYALPLCAPCRDGFVRRPLPLWIWGSIAVVALMVVVALFRFPESLGGGIAFERGERAEERGDYRAAAGFYREAMDRFPNTTEILARLAIVDCRAGNLHEAAELLRAIEGRKADPKLVREVDRAVEEVSRERESGGGEGADSNGS